jgi:Family of unknown function (DUF5372)
LAIPSAEVPEGIKSRDEIARYVTQQHAATATQVARVTHPHHPLKGQQLTIVCIRKGVDPDIVVQLPDGTHAALAMSATDYAASPQIPVPDEPIALLDLQGLCGLAVLVERLLERPRTTPTSQLPPATGAATHEAIG